MTGFTIRGVHPMQFYDYAKRLAARVERDDGTCQQFEYIDVLVRDIRIHIHSDPDAPRDVTVEDVVSDAHFEDLPE